MRFVPRPKPSDSKSNAPVRQAEQGVPEQRIRWARVIVVLAAFVAVFAFTTKTLIRERLQSVSSAPVENSSAEVATSKTAETKPVVRSRGDNNVAPATVALSEASPTPQALNPVPTVTVSIDPANGLLAKAECPVKTRVTYPSGSEPHAYCNVTHVAKTRSRAA